MTPASQLLSGSTPRLVACPTCRSEGFIEHGHPNAPHPDWVEPCPTCDGDGCIEIEAEPITVDDLDDMSGDATTQLLSGSITGIMFVAIVVAMFAVLPMAEWPQ